MSEKWLIAAVLLLIIVVGGCVYYYTYTTAQYEKEAAKHAEIVRQLEKGRQTKPIATTETEQATGKINPEESDTPTTAEADTPKRLRIGDVVDGRIYLGTEPPSPELLAQFGIRPPTQDEIISPYGFGPYPELPEGFGPITWPRRSANAELMIRVKIKLLKQGVPVKGSAMENGLVYPILKGVRYVIWGETTDGRQYLRRSLGHPDDGDYLRSIIAEKKARNESLTQADVPLVKLIPLEEAGIDPYTFLDLPK